MDSYLRLLKPKRNSLMQYDSLCLNRSENTIGRSLSNTIVLPSIEISRSHCLISQSPDLSWAIKDTSSGEIKINNSIISKHVFYPLTDKDVIQFDTCGDFTYIFESYQPNVQSDIINSSKQINRKRKKNKRQTDILVSNIIKKSTVDYNNIEYDSQMLTDNPSLNLKEQNDIKSSYNSNCISPSKLQISGEVSSVTIRPVQRDIFCVNTEISNVESTFNQQKSREKFLEDENRSLIEKLKKQTAEFEKNLAQALSIKHKKIDSLKQQLNEGKLNMENKIIKMEHVHKKELENLKITMTMELNDLKKHVHMGQEEINELNMKLYDNDVATERVKQIFLDELKQKEDKLKRENDNMISEYILKNATLELEKDTIEKSLNIERTNFQNILSAKEVERKNLLNALLLKTTQAERSLKILKKKMTLHVLTDKNKRQSKRLNEASKRNEASSSKAAPPPPTLHKCTVIDEYNNLLETELRCSICTEIFIKPATLNCGHTFCKHCLNLWKRTKSICPVCRARIKSDSQNITLDSLIGTIISKLDEGTKKSRLELMKERDAADSTQIANARNRRRSSAPSENNEGSSDESLDSYASTNDLQNVLYFSFGYRRYNYYEESDSDEASSDDD